MTIVFDDEQDIYDAHFASVAREHEAIGEARGEARGETKGKIETTIEDYKEFGQSKESTVQRLIEKFNLSPDEAKEKVNAAWKD